MIPEVYYTEGIPEFVATLFPVDFEGVCVDVGANHPLWISNSLIFEKAGWQCWCIEPNPNCIPLLKKHRKHVLEFACGAKNEDGRILYVYFIEGIDEAGATGLHEFESYEMAKHHCKHHHQVAVRVRTLDWLMDHEIKQDHIDYLSIDVERGEMNVLEGADLKRWNPKVISIELHDQPITGRELQPNYLESRGYHKVSRIAHDEIYVRD